MSQIKNRSTRSLQRELKQCLSADQIRSDLVYRYAFSRDAGFYHLLPNLVLKARTVQDISTIFRVATQRKRTVTFRAGGTSLSGQAISDDILVEVKEGWREVLILNEGRQIKLQSGVIAARANQYLEPYGYRIGPDPGSIRSARIGGIVANNASGIGSGNHADSYQTMSALELVLPNGLVLDTAQAQDYKKLESQAPHIFETLQGIRQNILRDPVLKQKIRNKYKLKNTMGYALNSFIDYEHPLDILAHLMIGSEGTLGFISRITFQTIPLKPFKSTALLLLRSLDQAARLVPKLKKIGSYALEIMDDSAIRAIQHISGLPEQIYKHIPDGSAALLVEYQSENSVDLKLKVDIAQKVILEYLPATPFGFFTNPIQREKLWKARRELGPLHAAMRPPGTTVLSEDVCFKVKDLSRAIKDLQFLFKHYHFDDAVIFGHAGDGNLHFKLSLNFAQDRAIEQYGEFMLDLVELVIDKYKGSLKAEHGTGRNMAPFLEKEWGPKAYLIMQEIKQLLDPSAILNPGVVISRDNQIHLKHIKTIPMVDPLIDKCIECGLCEPWCPSADLTLTPRHRINVLREIETLKNRIGDEKQVRNLQKAFMYAGIETCAADGLCGLSCPLDIDTGLQMKHMRTDYHGRVSQVISHMVRRYFSISLAGFRFLLNLLTPLRYLLRYKVVSRAIKALPKASHGILPAFNAHLLPAPRLPLASCGDDAQIIYFPSCINRGLADPAQKHISVPQAFIKILQHANIPFTYPDKLDDLCCGLSFHSKGFQDTAIKSAVQTTEMLWISSQGGQLPIVMDTSPCSLHLKHYDTLLSGIHLARWRNLEIVDIVEFLHDEVLDKLSLHKVRKKVVLHPTCASRRMGIEKKMEKIAIRCAREVIIPIELACCGFAGDRGLRIPELTESATTDEAREVKQENADGHYSTSRTCEIGMSQSSGRDYQSLIYLVYDALLETPKDAEAISNLEA